MRSHSPVKPGTPTEHQRKKKQKKRQKNEWPEMVEDNGEGTSCKPREDGVLKTSGHHLMAASH